MGQPKVAGNYGVMESDDTLALYGKVRTYTQTHNPTALFILFENHSVLWASPSL